MDRAELVRLLGAHPVVAEPRDVVVEERDPARFMAAFTDAVAAGGNVFIADPAWGQIERAQFNALSARASNSTMEGVASGFGWLCLPTGGSSGAIKLARHDEETLSSAVNGFCEHFGVRKINAVGLLPLNHVSGLMAWMRTVLTGGEYRACDWKVLAAGGRPALPVDAGDWFLSLVPTQLQRMLADPEAVDWLRGFRAVFVGGGPSWPELIEAGARAQLPLAFSYGMTETAAMVAALRPSEFLEGRRGSGTPLPHARITLDGESGVVIEAGSLFRGYWPEFRAAGPWSADDTGVFDEHGSIHLLGRRDALIITGGKKVDPFEIEAVLRATGEFADIVVVGVPDREWGEVVVACYPPVGTGPYFDRVSREIGARLAAYKHPKRYIAVPVWPRNAQGKVNRAELIRLALG
ncbi:MAG TPA: AMP-binding protein [Rariglobus sp.]|jgi:O-succinylbenzoic acid--CoA ligase|nr:AMP-binding protein [Rariglobus sp.]